MDETRRILGLEPHMLLMSVLCLGAVLLGYLILPGEPERVAMLERDGKGKDALAILKSRFEAGDTSQRTLYQLQALYEQHGDLPGARRALEMLAKARPRDVGIQRRLAAFYKQTQDEAAYLAALRRQIDLRYSEAACRELIGTLRRNGSYAQEQAVIQRCRQLGYRRPEDLIRLAMLLAAEQDFAQASHLLRSVDDLRKLKTDSERLRMFSILLKAEQPREAHRRAVRWIRGARENDMLALTLVEMLVADQRHDMAIALARDASTPGDSLSLTVAEILLDRSQGLAAQAYLTGWLEKAKLSDVSQGVRFVEAALDAQDPGLAFKGARKFGLQKLPQTTLAGLAAGLAAAEQSADLAQVSALLAPSAPLAGPAIAEGGGTARPQIASLPPSREVVRDSLDSWRLALWQRLLARTGRDVVAGATTIRRLVFAGSAARSLRAAKLQARAKATPVLRRHKKLRRYRLRQAVTAERAARNPGLPKQTKAQAKAPEVMPVIPGN